MTMNYELEILLVEDNPMDAELAIHALKKHRLANRIIHVTDGQAALDHFSRGGRDAAVPPTLVLLDLKLPKVSGIEVLRQLRADERTSQVPVVVLTSSSEDRDVMETYNLGANSYIVKPVEFENFSAAINNMGLYWMLLSPRQDEKP
jgi:two-component system, response regulator